MVFDRNAITTGRTILDFGLGDMKGAYQNTARLRGKGWLVVLFFAPKDPYSAQAAQALEGWVETLPGDKVSLFAVGLGGRTLIEEFAGARKLPFPVACDHEEYVSTIWSITALPTLFVIDASGKVLARVEGSEPDKLAALKSLLDGEIKKAADAAKAQEAAKAAEAGAKPPEQTAAPKPPAAPKKEPRGKKLAAPKKAK